MVSGVEIQVYFFFTLCIVVVGYTFSKDLSARPPLSGVGCGKKTTFIVSIGTVDYVCVCYILVFLSVLVVYWGGGRGGVFKSHSINASLRVTAAYSLEDS